MSILDKIVDVKRVEVAQAKQRVPADVLREQAAQAPDVRSFVGALAAPGPVRLIAELKKASPSAGVIREDFDPERLARVYETNGASAISVLTDVSFFQGSLEFLRAVRGAVGVPLLRKDFCIDEYQVLEARAAGADAVLLIAEILPGETLDRLLGQVHAHGMTALVELYDAANVDRVVASGARVIGINNRDLKTFQVDLGHTETLLRRVPDDRIVVSESGVRTRADVERLGRAGARAILVGETLMRAPDVGAKVRELSGGQGEGDGS